MTDLERRPQTAVVKLPREIDLANAADVFAQLISAIASDTEVLVVDMTSTDFCDSSGIREIMHVRAYAMHAGVEFRVVVPPGGVLRVLQIQGLDWVLKPYPTLEAALASLTPPRKTGAPSSTRRRNQQLIAHPVPHRAAGPDDQRRTKPGVTGSCGSTQKECSPVL
jgi:anti-sigma B factor antagonist